MEKNLTVEMLSQLKKEFNNDRNDNKDRNHINVTNLDFTIEQWEELGKPYHWEIVEEKDDFKVVLDTAYGHIALFKSDVLLDVSSRTIILEDIVILDKDYYGTDKYIWL